MQEKTWWVVECKQGRKRAVLVVGKKRFSVAKRLGIEQLSNFKDLT